MSHLGENIKDRELGIARVMAYLCLPFLLLAGSYIGFIIFRHGMNKLEVLVVAIVVTGVLSAFGLFRIASGALPPEDRKPYWLISIVTYLAATAFLLFVNFNNTNFKIMANTSVLILGIIYTLLFFVVSALMYFHKSMPEEDVKSTSHQGNDEWFDYQGEL